MQRIYDYLIYIFFLNTVFIENAFADESGQFSGGTVLFLVVVFFLLQGVFRRGHDDEEEDEDYWE